MTDRWLSSCLVDSDGRIFIDRDGEAFGDILRYLRGGADFLSGLLRNYSSSPSRQGGSTLNQMAMRASGIRALKKSTLPCPEPPRKARSHAGIPRVKLSTMGREANVLEK